MSIQLLKPLVQQNPLQQSSLSSKYGWFPCFCVKLSSSSGLRRNFLTRHLLRGWLFCFSIICFGLVSLHCGSYCKTLAIMFFMPLSRDHKVIVVFSLFSHDSELIYLVISRKQKAEITRWFITRKWLFDIHTHKQTYRLQPRYFSLANYPHQCLFEWYNEVSI